MTTSETYLGPEAKARRRIDEMLTAAGWVVQEYKQIALGAAPGVAVFAYECTGVETTFTNALDPQPASRRVFSFHRPETLAETLDALGDPDRGLRQATLRRRLLNLPPLDPKGLWTAQETAIRNTEDSLKSFKPRALIQMATGSGKSFTAANLSYRLIKFATRGASCSWWTGRTSAAKRSRSSRRSPHPTTAGSSPSCTTSSTFRAARSTVRRE